MKNIDNTVLWWRLCNRVHVSVSSRLKGREYSESSNGQCCLNGEATE